MSEQTIAAISSAVGEAGIGIVRMSGDQSLDIAKRIYRNYKKNTVDNFENKKMTYGYIYDQDEMLDEVLLALSLIHISEPTRREWLSRMPSSA